MCRRALRVSNATNLIFPNEKMALKDGLNQPDNQQDSATTLSDLLFGEDPLEARFKRNAHMLERIGAHKWTTATYFLCIVHPEEYLFLKPTIIKNAADISGFDINYQPQLNWRTYELVLEFANYLKQELVEPAPRDMIDV